MKTNHKQKRSLIFFGYILPISIFLIHCLYAYSSNLINDDAFIFYRYAQNWHNGYGLVWNIGEPPINGFTSWGYVFLLKTGLDLGYDALWIGQLIGVTSSIFVLLFTTQLALILTPKTNSFLLALPALYLAISADLAKWSRYGMETTLFAALLLLAVYFYLKSIASNKSNAWRFVSTALFLLSAIVRLEAALFWFITQLHFLFIVINPKNNQPVRSTSVIRSLQNLREHPSRLASIFIFISTLSIFLILQKLYFGSFLPNTFYAKSTAGGAQGYAILAGIRYILSSYDSPSSIGLWMLPIGLITIKTASEKQATFRYLLIPSISIYLSYIIWIGGDHFPGYRFYIFLLPLTIAFAVDVLNSFPELMMYRKKFILRTFSSSLLLLIFLINIFQSLNQLLEHPDPGMRSFRLMDEYDGSNPIQRNRELIGKFFYGIGKPGETLAVVPAGAIPYYSTLNTIDMLGLNDRFLARQPVDLEFVNRNPRGWYPGHMKGDGSYIFNLRPTYIVIDPNISDDPDYTPDWSIENYRPTFELWAMGEFHACYDPVTVELGDGYFTYHKLEPINCPE